MVLSALKPYAILVTSLLHSFFGIYIYIYIRGSLVELENSVETLALRARVPTSIQFSFSQTSTQTTRVSITAWEHEKRFLLLHYYVIMRINCH